MQLCKPQMPHEYVREPGAHNLGEREFPRRLSEVRDVVPERGKGQFLSWKHSAWETLSQKSVKRTHVCACRLRGEVLCHRSSFSWTAAQSRSKSRGCRPLTSEATRGAGQGWEGRNER